jgi:predicted RNA-binding Zn ribbon-like protein
MTHPKNPFSARGFGGAAPWLDLVNSELLDGFGHATECLDDPKWLRTFAEHWKLRESFEASAAQEGLRALRALLRRLVEKNAARGSLGPREIVRLNAWLKIPVFPRVVENQNGLALELRPAQIGWKAELAGIARSFADALIRAPQGRLKICANAECAWVFVDRTKGNVRRWCNDATCGNRDRVRRSRAAHKK